MAQLIVEIDGIKVEIPIHNYVKVIIGDLGDENEDGTGGGEIHTKFTHEGTITDIVRDGEIVGSTAVSYPDAIEAFS